MESDPQFAGMMKAFDGAGGEFFAALGDVALV